MCSKSCLFRGFCVVFESRKQMHPVGLEPTTFGSEVVKEGVYGVHRLKNIGGFCRLFFIDFTFLMPVSTNCEYRKSLHIGQRAARIRVELILAFQTTVSGPKGCICRPIMIPC